ncbi:MAG: hypothetical protein U1E27_09555, partial [Kiritimatiellia bacterium]|nr:hypothetical protein [Kiritimatiellia bacterium]
MEPGFDGSYPKLKIELESPVVNRGDRARVTQVYAPTRPPDLPGLTPSLDRILSSIGAPLFEHLDGARRLLAELPDDVLEAARDPLSAPGLVAAILMATSSESERDHLCAALVEQWGSERTGRTTALLNRMSEFPRTARLSLVDLAIPALREMPEMETERFLAGIDAMAEADQHLSLFEFALSRILRQNLHPSRTAPIRPALRRYALQGLERETGLLLSALAREGHPDESRARPAFARALACLPPGRNPIPYLSAEECQPDPLGRALDLLRELAPHLQRQILSACLTCMVHDGRVEPAEHELFRAVAATFNCPVPPSLQPVYPGKDL